MSDDGCLMLDVGCWMADAGCRRSDAGCLLVAAGLIGPTGVLGVDVWGLLLEPDAFLFEFSLSILASDFRPPTSFCLLASALFWSKYSSLSFFNFLFSCLNCSLMAALLFLWPNLS